VWQTVYESKNEMKKPEKRSHNGNPAHDYYPP
jgi:hypothetical protein